MNNASSTSDSGEDRSTGDSGSDSEVRINNDRRRLDLSPIDTGEQSSSSASGSLSQGDEGDTTADDKSVDEAQEEFDSPILVDLIQGARKSVGVRSAVSDTTSGEGSRYSSDDEEYSKKEGVVRHRIHPTKQQSEWDRALMTGKSSTGRASDFFSSHHPVLSTDSSEFLSIAAPTEPRVPKATKQQPLSPQQNAQHHQRDFPMQRRNILQSKPPHPQNSPAGSAVKGSTVVSVQTHARKRNSSNHKPPDSTDESNSSTGTETFEDSQIAPISDGDVSAGVLPDVLMNMRQKIESMTMFDSDMMRLTTGQVADNDVDDPMFQESRDALKRSSQQSISAAVLVSLSHKRYERRRLAAMEIEKVVRSLIILQQQSKQNKQQHDKQQHTTKNELERVRAILLLLSDDYIRSTSEDARKGGVVALAACSIGLGRASDADRVVQECRDLILAGIVHACQDHMRRVRYYATESLFIVVKSIPSLAVQHFFILFEVLRSLFADVDSDVRSAAELFDRKLKDVIVGAMNAGIFKADDCVPVFARFVYMRNKATKRLTLTWLQELNEKLIGAPILQFLHLFLGGVIEMVADPSVAIRQSALAFLQSVLPKLLTAQSTEEIANEGLQVDFDNILQSLVATMEHANPFVRKVAMYWMSRIVKAHMTVGEEIEGRKVAPDGSHSTARLSDAPPVRTMSAASISVRNSVPHVLPGILLSVGDDFISTNSATTKDSFLPDQTTRSLAEITNACIQDAVSRDGQAYVEHLDGFIVALREEMATPGGFALKTTPGVERTPYRMDVVQDGTGIESGGWFPSSKEDAVKVDDDTMVMSRLCALHWVIVLYESVVPISLKADYAREFVLAIIQQLADNPPNTIVFKSLEVLARITVPVSGEDQARTSTANPLSALGGPSGNPDSEENLEFPMTDSSMEYSMNLLDSSRRCLKSRDRTVFSALLQLHANNEELLSDLSNVLTYMCSLQPPEFVMVSFALEIERFIQRRQATSVGTDLGRDLKFVSSFVQHMNHVLLNAAEAEPLRQALKDCISAKEDTETDHQRSRLFHILLHSFSHNIAATLSLCLWAGAYRTALVALSNIDPLDIGLVGLLEIDRLIELLERPLFRHLHVRMLERNLRATQEGSGEMLFQLLKSLLMIVPQSACYRVLRDRLVSVSRFRQSALDGRARSDSGGTRTMKLAVDSESFITRVLSMRDLHCSSAWLSIRQESLEIPQRIKHIVSDQGSSRRSWLGYESEKDQMEAAQVHRDEKLRRAASRNPKRQTDEDLQEDLATSGQRDEEVPENEPLLTTAPDKTEEKWMEFWSDVEK